MSDPQSPYSGQPPQWSQPPSQPGWAAPPPPRSGPTVADFVMFRWMITPSLIVVIWIIGFVLITIFSITALSINNVPGFGGAGVLSAIAIFIFGQLYLRVVLEFIAVLFRVHDSLRSIDRKTPESR